MTSYPYWLVLKYLKLITMSSGNLNVKLYEHSSYSTTFSYPFGRYRYTWLPFGVALVGNIFPRKIGKLLQGLPNMFDISSQVILLTELKLVL